MTVPGVNVDIELALAEAVELAELLTELKSANAVLGRLLEGLEADIAEIERAMGPNPNESDEAYEWIKESSL